MMLVSDTTPASIPEDLSTIWSDILHAGWCTSFAAKRRTIVNLKDKWRSITSSGSVVNHSWVPHNLDDEIKNALLRVPEQAEKVEEAM